MAKYELKLRQRDITNEELLADLCRVATEFKSNTVTTMQYGEKGKFSARTFVRKFGSWNNALESASLVVVNRQRIPEEELFENIAKVWQHLGRQPYGRDMEKSFGVSTISLGTYELRFGTWNKALVRFIDFIENGNVSSDTNSSDLKKIKQTVATRTPRNINWRLRAIVLIRDNCICKMCGASPAKDSSVTLHIDHIKPWSKGGETVIGNLQTLCSVCNIGKSDLE